MAEAQFLGEHEVDRPLLILLLPAVRSNSIATVSFLMSLPNDLFISTFSCSRASRPCAQLGGEPTTEQGLNDGWIPFLVPSCWKLACNPRHIHAEDVCQSALGWTQSAELDVIEGWPTPERSPVYCRDESRWTSYPGHDGTLNM